MQKKRIVVKVGTSTLTHKTGKTNIQKIGELVSEPFDRFLHENSIGYVPL